MGCQQLLFKMWDGISCLNEVEMVSSFVARNKLNLIFPRSRLRLTDFSFITNVHLLVSIIFGAIRATDWKKCLQRWPVAFTGRLRLPT